MGRPIGWFTRMLDPHWGSSAVHMAVCTACVRHLCVVYPVCFRASMWLRVHLLPSIHPSIHPSPLYRLPNLVVGIMSRETVNNALALGIGAEQVGASHPMGWDGMGWDGIG